MKRGLASFPRRNNDKDKSSEVAPLRGASRKEHRRPSYPETEVTGPVTRSCSRSQGNVPAQGCGETRHPCEQRVEELCFVFRTLLMGLPFLSTASPSASGSASSPCKA